VLDLATALREAGVDVVLDKWELKEGHDAFAFMEKMVTDAEIKKVVIVCDQIYAEKANGRSGGVGAETQIISPEIYEKQDQHKFVAVLAERDDSGKAYLPAYYKSRIYIDLSNNDLYSTNFEQLLRWIYDKPLYVKPELGEKPSFLSEEKPVSLGTTTRFKRALDAIRNNKEYAKGALDEYFSIFATNLEAFRIKEKTGEFDDKVIKSIEDFLPFRDEAIEIFFAIAQYSNKPETISQLHNFFERLIPYTERPQQVTSWQEWDFDNYRFILYELFLYCIACLLKYECFGAISFLLRQNYYFADNSEYGKDVMEPFTVFRKHARSLAYRNERLKLRRLCLESDLMIQRANTSGVNECQLMQADFILFVRDSLDCLRNNESQEWWPCTLLYVNHCKGPFEIFARAQSKEYFDKIKTIFEIPNKSDLVPLMAAFRDGKMSVPRWDFTSVSPEALMSFEKLATKA
jgi:hypothetical protein